MQITHHPDPSTLMSFAAGSLPESLSAVVAAHLSLCAECRAEVRGLELVGGALLDTLAPIPVLHGAPTVSPQPRQHARFAGPPQGGRAEIPPPVSQLVGGDIDKLAWRRLAIGLWHLRLPLSRNDQGDLRLLKVAGGQAMPEHGHAASELTLVLRGAYDDATGCYRAGDIADLGDEIEHRPVAAPEGCVCLIAADGRMRFKGLLPRLLQPLTGM